MDRLDDVLAARRRVAASYDDALRDLDWLATPVVPEGLVHAYQAYVCLFRPAAPVARQRARAQRAAQRADGTELDRRGVATRQGTHAPVLTRLYRERYGVRPGGLPERRPRRPAVDRRFRSTRSSPTAEQETVVSALRTSIAVASSQ